MDRILRPERFDVDPNTTDAAEAWQHWLRTFTTYLASLATTHPILNQLDVLINHTSPSIYKFIASCTTLEEAVGTLDRLYIKTKNEVFARHLLATRRQRTDESLDAFLIALRLLSRDCNFKAVTAAAYQEEAIRDAFINGISSPPIRQRLLENKTLDLQTAFDQALSLDLALRNSASYATSSMSYTASIESQTPLTTLTVQNVAASAIPVSRSNPTCYFCGGNVRHSRRTCPAGKVLCRNCGKRGHYAKVCRSTALMASSMEAETTSLSPSSLASMVAASSQRLYKATVTVLLNRTPVQALVDTGSSDSYVALGLVRKLQLPMRKFSGHVTMAETSLCTSIVGVCVVDINVQEHLYSGVRLAVLPNLCADLLLGHDLLNKHEKVEVIFGGALPTLSVCGLTCMEIPTPSLFHNLTPDCRPIATKSRRYSSEDVIFIRSEIQQMLSEGIIEPSSSPWRAQVLVTRNERHRKRLVIDYSQTINRFTQLDAYPLPRIDDLVNEIAQYSYFSTLDLKSAYHQVPLAESDKPYTAFEACGNLYQFRRIPFGVTNGVSTFQRVMNTMIETNGLKGTFAYLDNVTICGKTQEEHDVNLNKFKAVAHRISLVLNDGKCDYSVRTVRLLGYEVSQGIIKPDPERLRPLMELPLPQDQKTLRQLIGLFSYYSTWVVNFSAKIRPLAHATTFPLTRQACEAFKGLKEDIAQAMVQSIDPAIPFVVETDASEFAIAATLNQAGRPVAFFSRTLNDSEQRHSAVEKEAYAIVEAIRRWRHYLIGHHFTLFTDQKSVSFMFDAKHSSKIKNDKIMRWRIELASYLFDIVYRPGRDNVPADALSRVCSFLDHGDLSHETLTKLHSSLCHPGVTRMAHFVRVKNMPYSVDDIRKITSACSICSRCKPSFYQPQLSHLIKATQPFERICLDFKGPVPSTNGNRYLLTVVDEYSRFPFAFPCSDVSSATVIKCLTQLFSIFGMPSYVHSDRGTAFMSVQLKAFLLSHGISSSRTTPYNPQGNGQSERFNGIIWNTVTLALHSKQLQIEQWQLVLPNALHSIRSLLCTATNATPHERLFNYVRRSTSGQSLPTWLSQPGPVLVRRHVRQSKYEPMVDEAELIEANTQYAHIRYPNGRESTVTLRDLAPWTAPELSTNTGLELPETSALPSENSPNLEAEHLPPIIATEGATCPSNEIEPPFLAPVPPDAALTERMQLPPPISEAEERTMSTRRSLRSRRPVDRLNL